MTLRELKHTFNLQFSFKYIDMYTRKEIKWGELNRKESRAFLDRRVYMITPWEHKHNGIKVYLY